VSFLLPLPPRAPIHKVGVFSSVIFFFSFKTTAFYDRLFVSKPLKSRCTPQWQGFLSPKWCKVVLCPSTPHFFMSSHHAGFPPLQVPLVSHWKAKFLFVLVAGVPSTSSVIFDAPHWAVQFSPPSKPLLCGFSPFFFFLFPPH